MTRLLKKLLSSTSLEETLAWAFGLGIALILVLGTFSMLTLHESRRAEHDMERTHNISATVRKLTIFLDDVQDGARGYIITGDEAFLQPYRTGLIEARKERAKLDDLLSPTPKQDQAFEKFSLELDQFLDSFPPYIEMRRKQGFEAAARSTKRRFGLNSMLQLRNQLDSMAREENRLLAERNQQHEVVETRHRITLVSGGILGLLLLIFAWFRIRSELFERKKNQQRMLENSKMAALGEMAAGIAHEINNPLGIIRGRAQVLRLLNEKEQLTPSKIRESCLNIEETVTRIATIVSGLLSFARNEQGEELRSIMLDPLLESTIELCKSRFRQKNVEMKILRPSHPIRLRCRPIQLSQVLLNLLNNAFDAAQESATSSPWVELRIEENHSMLHFAIVDSGPGVPPEFHDKIMEPFFTTKKLGKGTGLGLSVSKGIIEAHGGKLQFLGNDPHTCFEVSLPK